MAQNFFPKYNELVLLIIVSSLINFKMIMVEIVNLFAIT